MKLSSVISSAMGEHGMQIDVQDYVVRRMRLNVGATVQVASANTLLIVSSHPVSVTNDGQTFTASTIVFNPAGATIVEALQDCLVKILEMV